ncbi:hypothetical protein [Undibacterium squillarum]|uniref:hypothetical protein n=1 Tax=Undibacterium squillarum TaxID=1131567 RepID=UPI0035B2C15A
MKMVITLVGGAAGALLTQTKLILTTQMSRVQKEGISTLIIWLAKGSLVIEAQGTEAHRSQIAVAWKNVATAD